MYLTRYARLLSIPTHLQPERIPNATVFHLLHQYRVNKRLYFIYLICYIIFLPIIQNNKVNFLDESAFCAY